MGLRDEILALDPALLATRDNTAIAAAVSVGRIRIVPRQIGKGTVVDTLGLAAANVLLDVIDSAPEYRHVKQLLENGWFNVGSPLARSSLDALVGTVLTQAQADALKALAEAPDPVSEYQVRCTMYSAETGEWLGG